MGDIMPVRQVDLIFIVRTSDMMVIDRRRAPLPNGFVAATGTTVVNGYSEGVTRVDDMDSTGSAVVPNAFIWNGDDPASFTSAPPAPPPTGDSTVAQLDSIEAKANATLQTVTEMRAALGLPV